MPGSSEEANRIARELQESAWPSDRKEEAEALRNQAKELMAKVKALAELPNPNLVGRVTGSRRPILCLDFDGVIHSYTSGWKGADFIPDPPVEGAIRFLWECVQHFEVHIFSSRSNQPGGIGAMKTWLASWDAAHWASRPELKKPFTFPVTSLVVLIQFPTEKPPAFLTIDDRAWTFTGKWPTIQELQDFKPWNKQSA